MRKRQAVKKIVIAADSFKGSITSQRFAEVCAEAIESVMPQCETVEIALGDGGEGTVEALTATWGGRIVEIQVEDPLGRTVTARYGVSADGQTAVMEMAQASGLPLLEPHERNPLLTSSFGTGQMISDALDRGCCNIAIGIGGSATNDGGTGMLRALGARFYDDNNRLIDTKGCGADLERIAKIDISHLDPRLSQTKITVACDVDNPLCGPMGATHVFSAQKGADAPMQERLEAGMLRYAGTLQRLTGTDVASTPGAGAAGGMGAALTAILGAVLKPGIDMVLEAVDFDSKIAGADLIITGEGRADNQTAHGKTPYGVLKAARRQDIPVVVLCGTVDHCPELDNTGFAAVLSIQPGPITLTQAIDPAVACRNLADTVRQIVKLFEAGKDRGRKTVGQR